MTDLPRRNLCPSDLAAAIESSLRERRDVDEDMRLSFSFDEWMTIMGALNVAPKCPVCGSAVEPGQRLQFGSLVCRVER